jgi:hypothetical protein
VKRYIICRQSDYPRTNTRGTEPGKRPLCAVKDGSIDVSPEAVSTCSRRMFVDDLVMEETVPTREKGETPAVGQNTAGKDVTWVFEHGSWVAMESR